MKHLFQNQILALVAVISIVTLTVPQGAFASPIDASSTPPADTTTQTTDTTTPPTDPVVTTPTDPAPDTSTTTVQDTADTTSTTTDTDTDASTTDTDTPPPVHVNSLRSFAAVVPTCTVVSDTSTLHNNALSVLVSPIHAAWTAIANAGAQWIWGENPNGDPVHGSTETFTKTFTLTSVPTSASIIIAADNSYTASVNGHVINADPEEFNYTAAGQDTVTIPASDLVAGLNTLSVTVTNFAMANGTMATNPAGLLYTLSINGSACTTPPPPVTTSTVKMCKVDDSQTPLSGWTLLLKGDHVGSVAVAPDGNEHTVSNVPAGDYVLTSSGAYIYRPGDAAASTSDAAYSLRLPSDGLTGPFAPWIRENDFAAPNTGWLGIMLNDSLTNWGSIFHPDHIYVATTTLATAGNMNFKIMDDQYSDNSGSLNVDVDHGYEGITGDDGCTTFSNVPYGDYTTAELDQSDWTPVSGFGPVTVDSPTETLTVVNHHVVAAPNSFKVHIFKFLSTGSGEDTTEAQVPNDSTAPLFPMLATYSIAGVGTNLNPGDSYMLGNGGGVGGSDNGLLFAANTIPLAAGDIYGTHEVTGGDSPTVANQDSCTVGKYYLKGYQVGDTLAAAQNASISTTSPNFPSVSKDEYVIVVNAACSNGGDNGGGTATTTSSNTVVVHAEDLATDTTDAVANPLKWFFYNDGTNTFDDSLGSFVTGPATAPLQTGSAEISVPAGSGTILATQEYGGTRFDHITSLGYSTYRSEGDPALSLDLQFAFDNNLSDADTSYKGRLVYEPYFSHTVDTNTWQAWNPMDGQPGWWFSNGTIAATSGCTQSTPCTWAQVLAAYPNGGVSVGGVTLFKAGTWSSDFIGNVDDFQIGVLTDTNINTTTYDFEPTTHTVIANFVTGGGGGGGISGRSGSGPGLSSFLHPQVLGAATSTVSQTCGPILSSFLRIGRKNPTDQVTILQQFLNMNLGLSLPVTGFFGTSTEKAVEAFQAKYFPDVLTPWVPHGLPTNHSVTGYVYKTTLRKINLVACPTLSIPLPTLP